MDDAAFQKLMVWLQKVPLLKAQLPAQDFPSLGQAVRKERYVYQPSEALIHEGDANLHLPEASDGRRKRAFLKSSVFMPGGHSATGSRSTVSHSFSTSSTRSNGSKKGSDKPFALFFVISGTALVTINGKVHQRLNECDFWASPKVLGMQDLPLDSTVVASDDAPLEVLVLWDDQFSKLGLQKRIHFRKRIGLGNRRKQEQEATRACGAMGRQMSPGHSAELSLSPDEKDFLVKKLHENRILQGCLHSTEADLYSQIAEAAMRIVVEPGSILVSENDFGQNLYMVYKGSLDVEVSDDSVGSLPPTEASVRHRLAMKDDAVKKALRKGSPSLGPGSVFGELSLLYDAHYSATCRVSPDQEAEVFVIGRPAFRRCFYKDPQDLAQRHELLSEVALLSSCFSSEVSNLARQAHGFQDFQPGEVVLQQGRKRQRLQWYIIARGSALLSKIHAEGQPPDEVVLRRGDTFGERSVLWPELDGVSECTIRGGDSGMTCLCIDGEILRQHCQLTQTLPDNLMQDSKGWMETKKNQIKKKRTSVLNFDNSMGLPLKTIAYLGKGAYGAVFLQEDAKGNRFALKRMSKGVIADKRCEEEVFNEKLVTSLANSPFVLRFHTCDVDDQFCHLVIEALEGRDLDYVRAHKPEMFSNDEASRFYVACIAEGLEHLHHLRIIHRDVKPANIILDHRGYAKLCDLGLARFVNGKAHTFCGTLEYMAPEIVGSAPYSFEADWWSLGVMTYELLNAMQETPYGMTAQRVQQDIESLRPLLLQVQRKGSLIMHDLVAATAPAKDFILELLRPDPSQRLGSKGIGDIRSHAWFQDFNFHGLLAQTASCGVPYIPGTLVVRGPPPDLHNDYVLVGHWSHRLIGEPAYSQQKFMTLGEAKDLLDMENFDGFNVRHNGLLGAPLDAKTVAQVEFIRTVNISIAKKGLREAEGWTAYVMKDIPYEDYSAEDAGDDVWFQRLRQKKDNISSELPMCANLSLPGS